MHVKTLKIDYTANGKPLTISNNDGQNVIICPPAPPAVPRLSGGADDAVTLEAWRPGHYALKTVPARPVPQTCPLCRRR
jgi:hypothetical protein